MITGLRHRERLTLRRALLPYRSGSLDARFLLYGDLAWQASVAPILQYAKPHLAGLGGALHRSDFLEVSAKVLGRRGWALPCLGPGPVDSFYTPPASCYVVPVTLGLVLHKVQVIQG